jgi:hypothetical protein
VVCGSASPGDASSSLKCGPGERNFWASGQLWIPGRLGMESE